MLLVTFNASKIKSVVLIVLMGTVLGGSMLAFSLLAEKDRIYLEDYAARVSFIESCGYTTDGEETEVPTIIPSEWNELYESYNGIQKSQGLDLDSHRGESVTRYIYNITNHRHGENITATLITDSDGRLIACDISENIVGGEIAVLIDGK